MEDIVIDMVGGKLVAAKRNVSHQNNHLSAANNRKATPTKLSATGKKMDHQISFCVCQNNKLKAWLKKDKRPTTKNILVIF
jgi:hypothetical protein